MIVWRIKANVSLVTLANNFAWNLIEYYTTIFN